MPKRKSGGKRKIGRNSAKCARYQSENRRIKNKANRLVKRWKTYKTQPPKALQGLKNNKELFHMVKSKLEKNK